MCCQSRASRYGTWYLVSTKRYDTRRCTLFVEKLNIVKSVATSTCLFGIYSSLQAARYVGRAVILRNVVISLFIVLGYVVLFVFCPVLLCYVTLRYLYFCFVATLMRVSAPPKTVRAAWSARTGTTHRSSSSLPRLYGNLR